MHGGLLPLRVSSPSVYFPEQACDVTAVYEALLMENFTACNVGFYVCTKGSQRVRERWQRENEKQYMCGRVCVCLCEYQGLYIPSG